MKRLRYSLMVLGTGSHAGKTALAAALCRILSDRGWRVAPFKAQNMSLNSVSTLDGAEIAQAQAVQALAARCLPCREMNPVLLKPLRGQGSQVVVLGRPVGVMDARRYWRYWPQARAVAASAYRALGQMYEVIILEGAGSPAEVNLRRRDLANLEAARFSGAPWILACDIERGGSFAAVLGTLSLVPAWLRRRFAGVVFNRFRGDVSLLEPGLRWLRRRHGVRTLGVVPFLPDLELPEEDSLGLPAPSRQGPPPARALRVEILRHPSLANFNDLQPLLADPALDVRWRVPSAPSGCAPSLSLPQSEGRPGERSGDFQPDLVVIPGNKFTLRDMADMNRLGESSRLRDLAARGTWFLGICGGLQMLGREIIDSAGVDGPSSPRRVEGLGLLDAWTVMHPRKVVTQTACRVRTSFGSFRLDGYEIHHGRTFLGPGARELAADAPPGRPMLAAAPGGRILGGYLHAILDNAAFRTALLEAVARDRGRRYAPRTRPRVDPIARWAAHVARHVDVDAIPGFPGPR